MSSAQWIAIAAITVPALAIVLWPLVRGGAGRAAPSNAALDRRLELAEEKAATYRALKELDFDHEAGSLSDDDFQALRDRYEGRAAELITALDSLGEPAPLPAADRPPPAPRSWTRSPAAMVAGGLSLLALGIAFGVGVTRYTQPDETLIPPGIRIPVPTLPDPGPLLPGAPGTGAASMKSIPPEMLARMLAAARQSLFEGRYQEAIAAYQAVLKRDPKTPPFVMVKVPPRKSSRDKEPASDLALNSLICFSISANDIRSASRKTGTTSPSDAPIATPISK